MVENRSKSLIWKSMNWVFGHFLRENSSIQFCVEQIEGN